MHPRSTADASGDASRRYRPWAAAGVIASLAAVYAVLLAPATVRHDPHTRLHAAASALGNGIAVVEASYADGDLTVTNQHLGLPGSATHCARLRASLPDTGRAVLTCNLRQDASLRRSVRWQRSPSGQWRCDAHVAGMHAQPMACVAE